MPLNEEQTKAASKAAATRTRAIAAFTAGSADKPVDEAEKYWKESSWIYLFWNYKVLKNTMGFLISKKIGLHISWNWKPSPEDGSRRLEFFAYTNNIVSVSLDPYYPGNRILWRFHWEKPTKTFSLKSIEQPQLGHLPTATVILKEKQ